MAYELAVTKQDRAAAEAVYAELGRLLDDFPEDEAVIGARAAAAAALSGHCALEQDWPAACDYATAINRLNRDVSEKLNRELDLLYGNAATTTILALVQADDWWNARRLTYALRDLLLSDFMLSELARQRGAEVANDIKGLFEAMVDTFRDAEPKLAAQLDAEIAEKKGEPVEEPRREHRGRIEPRYEFAALKDVTVDGFLSMRVPARWPEGRTEEGRVGFWEEDVESGTLRIDWRVFEIPDSVQVTPETLAAQARALAGEGEVVEVGAGGEKGLLRLRRETFERGEPLVFHPWRAIRARGRTMLVRRFNLVLLADLAAREDFQALPEIIDREVRAARIDFGRIPRNAD